MIKFIKEVQYPNKNRTKIEVEVLDECTLDEILEEFQNFLRACGCEIDKNSVLDFVDMDQ